MATSKKHTSKRRGRPPRPLNPAWVRWDKERASSYTTLKGFMNAEGYGDEKWVMSMIKHWIKRCAKHLDAEPPKH